MRHKRLAIYGAFIGFALLLTACGAQSSLPPQTTASPLAATVTRQLVINTPTPQPPTPTARRPTKTATASVTPKPTLDATQQTWLATAIAIATTQRAASNLALDIEVTQAA